MPWSSSSSKDRELIQRDETWGINRGALYTTPTGWMTRQPNYIASILQEDPFEIFDTRKEATQYLTEVCSEFGVFQADDGDIFIKCDKCEHIADTWFRHSHHMTRIHTFKRQPTRHAFNGDVYTAYRRCLRRKKLAALNKPAAIVVLDDSESQHSEEAIPESFSPPMTIVPIPTLHADEEWDTGSEASAGEKRPADEDSGQSQKRPATGEHVVPDSKKAQVTDLSKLYIAGALSIPGTPGTPHAPPSPPKPFRFGIRVTDPSHKPVVKARFEELLKTEAEYNKLKKETLFHQAEAATLRLSVVRLQKQVDAQFQAMTKFMTTIQGGIEAVKNKGWLE